MFSKQTTKKKIQEKTQNHLNCQERKFENMDSQFFRPVTSIIISS